MESVPAHGRVVNKMGFNVPSNLSHPMILYYEWKCSQLYDVSQFTDINIFSVLGDLIWNTISTCGLFSAGQVIKTRREIKIDE